MARPAPAQDDALNGDYLQHPGLVQALPYPGLFSGSLGDLSLGISLVEISFQWFSASTTPADRLYPGEKGM